MVAPKNRRPGMMSESRVQDLKREVRQLQSERNAAREEVEVLKAQVAIAKRSSDFVQRELNDALVTIGILVNQQGGKVIIKEDEIIKYDGYLEVFRDMNTYETSIIVRPKKEFNETTGRGYSSTNRGDLNSGG